MSVRARENGRPDVRRYLGEAMEARAHLEIGRQILRVQTEQRRNIIIILITDLSVGEKGLCA